MYSRIETTMNSVHQEGLQLKCILYKYRLTHQFLIEIVMLTKDHEPDICIILLNTYLDSSHGKWEKNQEGEFQNTSEVFLKAILHLDQTQL